MRLAAPSSRALVALLALGGLALGGEDVPDRPPVPVANASFVFDGEAWIAEAFARAETAGEDARAWVDAVRALQDVVEAQAPPGDERAVAPYVVSVRGAECYEGAARAAHHEILAGGERALTAYESTFGVVATALLERGVAERSPETLAETVQRFLPLVPGRRAALLLADLALDRGDADEALAWLARLEDLEEVSTEPRESLAPWRAARIARAALALAPTPAEVAATRATLAAAASAGPAEAVRAATRLRAARRSVEPSAWTTTGGGPSRTVLPPSPGPSLHPSWSERLTPRAEPVPLPDTRERPSPAVLPRAIYVQGHVFVNDGTQLRGWRRPGDRAGPTRRLALPLRPNGPGSDALGYEGLDPPDPRETHGLVEGHALSAARRPGGRWMIYAAVKDRRLDAGSAVPFEEQDDHVRAFAFDGVSLRRAWRAGGAGPPDEDDFRQRSREGDPLLEGLRLYGAPLPYRGRLWVAGLRPTENSDRLEAWLVALDPGTGRLLLRTSLGFASPVRTGRPDEAIPSSVAAAEGRVVVVTGLGIAAAVDATDGRPVWLVRYDRDIVAPGRIGRLRSTSGESPRQSLFANEPPIVALGRAWFAPTDSSRLVCVHDRPRGPRRELLAWRRWRLGDQFGGMAAEQVVGLRADGTSVPTLVVLGKPAATEADPPGPVVVGLDALDDGTLLWQASSPTGAVEPYGRGLLTATEVFVPTAEGIAVFDVGPATAGRHLATLDATPPPGSRTRPPPEEARLWGSLIPLPGTGLLAVNEDWIALWTR